MATFLDSDGVFSDFDRQAHELLGTHPSTVGDAKFWPIAHANPLFWTDMPVMDGAFEFWDKIKHTKPTVLTGAPKGNFEHAADAKREWWLKYFNHTDVVVCLSKDKQRHITSPGDIIVDDTKRNIARWEKAGGIGILFTSHDQALEELRNLGII